MKLHTRRSHRDGRTWDEVTRDLVADHIANEEGALEAYQHALASIEDEGIRYLLRGIIEDERAHHRQLEELDAAVDAMVSGAPRIRAVPPVHPWLAPDELLEITDQLLAVEREDERELEELAGELEDTRWSSLWWIIVEQLRHDTRKHIATLEYLRELARHHREDALPPLT